MQRSVHARWAQFSNFTFLRFWHQGNSASATILGLIIAQQAVHAVQMQAGCTRQEQSTVGAAGVCEVHT